MRLFTGHGSAVGSADGSAKGKFNLYFYLQILIGFYSAYVALFCYCILGPYGVNAKYVRIISIQVQMVSLHLTFKQASGRAPTNCFATP